MAIHTTADNRILRDIQSGKYRDQYLVYTRKSTDEPENQKNSLAYQKTENLRFAEREHLPVASLTLTGFSRSGIIAESHSGFKEDNRVSFTKDGFVKYRIARPKFQRLVKFLSQGYFKGVICLCWDRVSRNKSDDAMIGKLMRSGIDVRFAFARYENTSAGALYMDIDGVFAAHHSRVTSEKVRLAVHSLKDRGLCANKAPLGYLNLGVSDEKPFDPVRAPIIQQMFELYVQSNMSLSDLACWANEQGLTTIPRRRRRTEAELLEEEALPSEKVVRPMTSNHVHRILTHPFYMGKVRDSNGLYIRATGHQAMISEALFYDVQEKLGSKRVSVRYEQKVTLPFRGRLRCGECGRVYTPYRQKGNLYLGVRCIKGCNNTSKNCSLKSVEGMIKTLFKRLSFNEKELNEVQDRASTDIALFEHKRHVQLESNERQKRKIREDLKYLRENKLTLLQTGAYDANSVVSEENRLNAKLVQLQQEEQCSDASMHDTMKDVIKLSELLKDAYSCYDSVNSYEKEQIVDLVFSELTLSGDTLKYICKNSFKALESRFGAYCGQYAWLSELQPLDEMRESIVALEKLVKKL